MNSQPHIAPAHPSWFKSSYSNGSGGECVECAWTEEGVIVRDSKQVDDTVVAIASHPWQAFVRGVDLPDHR
ncbi:DUF397 domain-containing protein [Streptomyces sp. TRM49041]|uniref:DUF397 domain-containing protein n=1 Tax=Streptomyces sp. TRM49041 TaxID=2603216 RepID=UPI0011EC893A|nr:DUF397 domain-containing protein [Streptomyces sp. TRM49041]